MEETPFEHEVVAVAVKLTEDPTVLLLDGEVTCTPDDPDPSTVTLIGVVDAPRSYPTPGPQYCRFPG